MCLPCTKEALLDIPTYLVGERRAGNVPVLRSINRDIYLSLSSLRTNPFFVVHRKVLPAYNLTTDLAPIINPSTIEQAAVARLMATSGRTVLRL